MKPFFLLFLLFFALNSCNPYTKPIDVTSVKIDTLQGQSLLGKDLISPSLEVKDSAKVKKYVHALETYNSNPLNPDFIIWLGRRTAYLGDYQAAIGIFHEGILKYPEDARFYRHRGHRYISTRQLDLAIKDLEQAATLIQDSEDVIEPDGIPNKLNTPVSSLHTNIYYHLGLAYYLKNDLTNALAHFDNCLQASQNDDMRVAASHWMYMILRRMNLPDEAAQLLVPINSEMTIIENDGYHQLLLYYKRELNENDLGSNSTVSTSEAVQYGIANWHHYNGEIDTARAMYQYIVDNGNWASFGYVAAEADLLKMQ